MCEANGIRVKQSGAIPVKAFSEVGGSIILEEQIVQEDRQ